MSPTTEKFLTSALTLPESERLELAEALCWPLRSRPRLSQPATLGWRSCTAARPRSMAGKRPWPLGRKSSSASAPAWRAGPVAEVSLHVAAEGEYEAALAWYWPRSARAAAGFEAVVERALTFLGAFPEACPLCDDRHRYCALRRYPYGLVYRVHDAGPGRGGAAIPDEGGAGTLPDHGRAVPL
jgi:plasmid stabilization system protein ParE